MLSIILKFGFILVSSFTTDSLADSMIGPGLWRVLSVEACEGEFPARLEVARRKVNRTHDGFNVRLDYDRDVDDSIAIRVDICKQVDGGCKPYQTLADDRLPGFAQKYAADNVRAFLQLADIDPPDFPIAAGAYEVRNFVFDYTELPPESIYGEFGAEARMLRQDQAVACLRLDVEFAKEDDAEDADER